MDNKKWVDTVKKIKDIFEGKLRKNGEPMYIHSVGVGEILKNWNLDDITIVAGCFHDVKEDTDLSLADIRSECMKLGFLPYQATEISGLVEACSYSAEEYALDKKARKKSACDRWGNHADYRVLLIKSADIKNNSLSAPSVSKEFHSDYRDWAGPLEEILDQKLLIEDQEFSLEKYQSNLGYRA